MVRDLPQAARRVGPAQVGAWKALGPRGWDLLLRQVRTGLPRDGLISAKRLGRRQGVDPQRGVLLPDRERRSDGALELLAAWDRDRAAGMRSRCCPDPWSTARGASRGL